MYTHDKDINRVPESASIYVLLMRKTARTRAGRRMKEQGSRAGKAGSGRRGDGTDGRAVPSKKKKSVFKNEETF